LVIAVESQKVIYFLSQTKGGVGEQEEEPGKEGKKERGKRCKLKARKGMRR